MVTISEVWFFPFIGLLAQIVATAYLIRIHRRIGPRLTEIFTGFNILAYTYLTFLFYALYIASKNPGQGALETFNIFFGLVYPVVNSVYHMRLKRYYKKGLESDSERDARRDPQRDTYRDAQRDLERDIDRDKHRDVSRDLYKDREPSSASGEEEKEGSDVNNQPTNQD